MSIERQNQYLDFLVDPSFLEINGLLCPFKIMYTEHDTQDIFFQ